MVISAQVPNIPSVFELVEIFTLKWTEKAAASGQPILQLKKTKAANFDAQYLWLLIGIRPDEDSDFSDTDEVQICITDPVYGAGKGRYCANWKGDDEYPGGYMMIAVPGTGPIGDQTILISSKDWGALDELTWLIDVWILALGADITTGYTEREHT